MDNRVLRYLGSIYSLFAKANLRRSLEEFAIGERSRIAFSKIKSSPGCLLSVGSDSLIETQIVFEKSGACVKIGDRTFVGNGLIASAENVSIGSDVLIAWGVTITDHNSHSVRYSERERDVLNWKQNRKEWDSVQKASVHISDKAWIGFNSIILKGVKIGEGAIVGAGSVVTKDVSAWTIVAGNPAKVIREIPVEER